MNVFSIDPGNEQSAWCLMNDKYELIKFAKQPNKEVMENMLQILVDNEADCIVIERMQSYSMGVGATTFITCEWIGRFSQEAEKCVPVHYLFRKDEKMYLCQTMKANDAAIRHALIDRFAKKDFKNGRGTKKDPDYFYGVSKDCWSAIAIATTFLDMEAEKKLKSKETNL